MKHVRIYENGNQDVLKVETGELPALGPGEVRITNKAIGVNILDIMQRRGAPAVALPSGLGLEGAAIITELGPDVQGVSVGERVGYIMGPIGAYASERHYPAERLIKLHDDLSFDEAAAVLFKGITAQYLIKTTYPVREGTSVLLYGATGALGRLMVPWMRHLGASVIGVVTKRAGIDEALAIGCAHALSWEDGDIPGKVASLTNGRKADVVYDGIGKETLSASLDSLARRGTFVSIGASSGAPDPVAMSTLNEKGSLYATRPGLAHHVADVQEYQDRARDVLDAVQAGIITPSVAHAFPLDKVADAHAALERGGAGGAVILRP